MRRQTPTPTRPSDRRGRDRFGGPGFSCPTAENSAGRHAARGHRHDLLPPTRSTFNRKIVERGVPVRPALRWLRDRSLRLDHSPLWRDQISVSLSSRSRFTSEVSPLQGSFECARRDRLAGPHGSSARGVRTTARPCEIGRGHSPGHAIVFLDTRARVFARSVRPRPCAGSMTVVMVVSISPFMGAPHATSNGRIRPVGRLRLDRLPATASPAFFPCRQGAAFLARQKSRLTPSSAVLRA